MSNPFEKYVQATERQNANYAYLAEGAPQLRATNVNEIPDDSETNTQKSGGDYLNDFAVATGKTIIGTPQALVGLADIAGYGYENVKQGYQELGALAGLNARPEELQYTGHLGKALEDLGIGFKESQDFLSSKYSEGYQAQQAGLHETEGLLNKAGYVWDNPALAGNTINESIGYMLAGGALSNLAKGALTAHVAATTAGTLTARSLTGAALAAAEKGITSSIGKRVALGALGEAEISAGILQENIRNQTEGGLTSPEQTQLAGAGGAVVGALGYLGGRLSHRAGAADLETAMVSSTDPIRAAYLKNMPISRMVKGGLIEGLIEEVPQENVENAIENLATNKGNGDVFKGWEDSTVLGLAAGAGTSAVLNAPQSLFDTVKDISSGLDKVKGAVSDAANLKSFDTLSNPEHKNYNPAQAFNIQLKNLESNDETVRTQAEASVSKIETDLNTARASVEKRIKSIQTTLKAMPPSDQTTDAQKLEIEALGKEYSELTTKSSTLADQYVAFLDAQVTAQEHRDVQQGTQFTEEQAKADIATLTQPSTAPKSGVWTVDDMTIEMDILSEPDAIGNVLARRTGAAEDTALEIEIPFSEVTLNPDTNPNAQQEALNRVTRHFSKYSSDDLDLLATSPVFNEAQRNSLRLMSESKRELAAVQDPSQVFDNILNGYTGKTIRESHRGLNQYTDMVNTAVATKNEQLADLALNGLGAFTDDHTAKRDAINEAFGLVQNGTYKEVQVVRTQDGTWGFVPFTAQEVRAGKNADGVAFLEGKALKAAMNKVGGFNVHINSNTKGAITQINNETQLIQDRFNALSGVAESFVGVTPKPVDTSIAPTVDTPIVTEPSDTTAPVDNPVPEAPVQSGVPATPAIPTEAPKTPEYTWGRYPNGKPNLEVSSHGNAFSKQFSAFIAKLSDGRTIEEAYQLDVKGYRAHGNDWRLGKGKPPINGKTPEELWIAYKDLWKQFFKENPALFAQMKVEAKGKVLTDKFAKSAVSQARAIAELLNEDISVAATVPTPSQDTPDVTERGKQAPTQTTADTEQLTEDLEAKIEARDNIIALHKEYTELDAKDNPTEWEQTRHDYLEDLFSDVIGAVADITYRNEMPSKEIQDELKKLIGEELFNEAMRIRNLPLSERDIAQNLLRQLIPVLRGVPENIDHITLNMLDEAKSEARERAVNRKGEAAGKVFDDVYLKLEKYLKSVETKTPPTKGIGKDTTTATPSDTVSIDKLEATVKSFVKVRDITSEEYKQDTATVYEKQWFKVKAAYNNTVRRLVELVSKGVTTVEDVAALTDILNKLYEFAGQTIDLNSDRAALDKLTQRIDSLATALFSDVSPEIIDAYLKGKTESTERRGDKLTTDRDGAKSFDGRTIEYAFNAPHLQETKTTAPVEAEPSIPETVEGLVKEYGYLGELLADEDVARVVKDVIETVLEVKAGEKRLTSYSRFVGLFAVHGYIEYFTKQAKNDPNIIKLTKAANKLRNLVRLTQHINFLEDYVDSQNNDDLRAYLNKYPELKSIFSELKVKNPTKGTRSLALDVIADFTQVKNLLTTELGKLVQLVGLMYIQAAFEKGQQYLRDTNYADLNEVLSPTVLALLKGEDIGVLAKNKVLGDDAAVRRNSITNVELTFLDKIDGIPVGELSKEDFETVKALVQNAVNAGFNSYKVVSYTRNEEKISSDIVHNIIVEHLPKEGFTLENFTPEEVINGAVPESFIWDFEKKTPETTENTGKDTTEVGFKLTTTGQYTSKDQLKADKATKFIGEGAANSSTAQYAKDAGDKANTGKYTKNDVVFISVNGARANRQAPNLVEIQKAIDAGATILTDKLSDRERSFNVGEREVAAHLTKNGYVEEGNTGVWKPEAKTPVQAEVTTTPSQDTPEDTEGVNQVAGTKQLAEVLTTQQSKASDVLTELKDSDSSRLPKEYKAYLDTLLEQVVKVFPDTLVQFVKDISEIPKKYGIEEFFFGKQGTFNDEKFVFIRQVEKTASSDRHEVTVHEFIHVATADYIENKFSGTQSKTVRSLLDAARAYVRTFKGKTTDGVKVLTHVLNKEGTYVQSKELLAYGLTHPALVAELQKIPYIWTSANGGIGTIASSMLEVVEPTNVYEALLVAYGNILEIEESKLESTKDNTTTEATQGLAVRTGNTSESTTESEPDVQGTDGGTGTGNVEVEQTSTESQVEPSAEAKSIYEKLGGKTATGNVQIKYVLQAAGVAFAKSLGGVFSLRVNGVKHHYGNPFSSVAKLLAADPSLIATKSTQESVERYIDWVLNSNDERAKWIRSELQSGELKGKPIIYYAELGEPSHANALDYLINTHVWGSQSATSEDTQTTTEPVATEDAKVTVLQGVTDEIAAEERKKPFNLRNILKGYFTQSTTKEDAVGANPLVTVKDFLKGLGTLTQVSDWLNDRRKPTQKQLDQVEHFKKFHAEFARALKFVFNTQASAIFVSNKENLVGYLEMGKKPSTRELDENVVTALALSAYSYLIKQGNKVMNTNEELETLFRFKKGMRAPLHIEQMFRFAGQEMPIVVKALGTDTAKALGLKVREDQDPTLQDRLNTALGILAMEAMAKAGFIVIETLQDHPTDEKNKPLTDFLTAIKAVRESKAHTIEDEYDFEVDTDAETQIKKFTMVRPNAKMEGIGNSVFEKGIIETTVDGKIIRTETLTLNRPVLTEGLPTLNSPLVNELIEANKDTKGFLSYLFGVDVGLTTPLKEIPKKFSQKLINGTDASVPSVQAALLTEAQKHSFTMRTNTVAVFAAMQKLGENSQFLKEILGIWIDDHVLSRTHVTERDSLQAKAQNDWTAVLNGLEWADATLDENGQYTQFYDTQFVAQNQRQHLNSNMFSAQSSQIHRAMAALTGFSTTIDLSQDEQGTVKDEALLNLFYQAVGEGLEGLDDYLKAGILSKAEAGLHQFFTVDKVYGDYYVPALKAFLQTTESKNAIKAMRVLIETGTIDATQQKAIAWFVEKGDMGAQSLQSLIALAELDIAQANGTTFTTTIGFGSDGVNHGVSAANMLTGVISKDMRQQTGIFPIAEKGQYQISNMQEVYKRKITDYYVDFGKVMSAKLRDLVGTLVGKLNTDFVQGMTALFPKFEVLDDTGELRDLLAMRKIAKIWAIPFNYSAGKAALQRALARGFLAGIYGNMNKLANEALDIIDAKKKEGLTAEQLAALDVKLETVKLKTTTLQDNLNKVLRKYGMSVTLPEPQLLNEEAQGKLSNELENTLMQAAIDLHGEAAWKATEEFAKDYLEVRNVYTEVEKASFTLFNLVRTQLIAEKRANRKYTNVAAKVNVKGKIVQYTAEEINAQEAEYFDLTKAEMAEVDAVLAAMRPMFNTALSVGSESTNDAGSGTNPSGVSVRKHKMQREPAKGLRAVNTYYLKEIDANRKPFSESRNIGLSKEVEENAGVASSANAVQSIDAYVAAKVQGFMNALNVHDAAIFGLKDFLKGVKKQNEEHLKALTNYQLGLEHAKMLVKVYVGYKAFMATQEEALKSEDVKVRENAQKLITEAKQQMKVLLWGEQMFKGDTALKINNQLVYKGGLIPKLQAANEDIKDSASIEEAISVFINFALKQDLQKLEVLLDTHSIHQFAGEGGMHQLTKADKASIEKQKALVQKALSDLDTELNGKPAPMNTTEAVKPITELAKFLRKAKGAVIDITSLIEHLTNNTDINDLKARAAQLEVLKAITPLIDKATKVIYSEGDYDGYGYYDEETNTLHINSAKEAEGGVRSTLAVHELLHAALSRRIKTLNASIETKEAEAKKTGKEVSFTPAEVALRNLEKLRVNLVTPDGMRMLELQTELGSAIEDSVQFYKETEALYESQKAENISTIKELQALNKEEARRVEIEGEIKKRGTGIGAAYKAQLEAELKTLTPKAELDTKRNALLTKQQAMRDTKALLDKANKYFELRETLSKKVLSERTRRDGSSSKFTQLNLVEMLTNIDEFISYGLTESRLQEAMKSTQVDRGGRTFSVKLRKFVEFVGQILGFRSKEISALAAFASDTAALLETIGSVTPVVAPNKGERLFSTQSAEDLVNGQSSLDIMTALPHSNTGAFNQQLDRLITEEIGQLYNQDDAAKARIDELQTFAASDALNAGFALSRKEQYVQQALQYAVAAYMKLHAGGANVGQLRRVYHAAKAKMDATGKDFHEGDWATATQQEKDLAKAKYDFLFDSTKEGYMSRFVSMALASEAVNKLLDIALPLTKPDTQDKTWFEKVNDWVSYVMAWLTNKYVRLNPIAGASNQLVQLMDNLVKLDIRARQEGVALHQKAWNTIGLVTTPLNKALKGAGGALLSGVGLRDSRFLPVRALGAILVLRSEEAAKAIPKMIIDMRNNQNPNTKLGEVCNILLEASGVGTLRDKFDVLIRQTNLNAKNRQDIVDNVKKAVNTWFKAPLTKVQSKAIAYGLLGTDAQALLENYSVEDIVNMALHEGKLNAEIAKLKKEIAKNPNGNDMLNAAEQLGYYMVTRIGGEGLVKNALGIAIGLGTQYFTSVEQADPKLVGQLNTLVSMLAMTHVPNSDKAILAALYKTDAEGIHATIQLHNGLVNDSLKDFQANPLNMVKGWMPEVTNPYLEIKAANSMVERQQMEAEGWVLIDELKRDKHDKGSPKYLMKHNDIGYQRLVSGAVDLGSTARSGTEAISRTSPKYLGITQARYQNAARRAAIPNGSFDPSKQPRGLIAAYDTDGVPLAYNYEMDNETRDAHLDRKHNIGDLLGTFGGLNYYKPEKAKQSNTVAEVLFEDYKANYSQNPNAYLKISHKSTDPKVVEMWRMLPQDFKQRATELYGKGNPIIIRNEAFNLAFGFKKFSVVSYAFDAVKAERERIKNGLVGTGKSPNAFQSGFVRLAEATRGNTAQADFAKAEHVTQEIVKAIKDFIVIRSGTTMMWNIFANVLMLMANGINPVTIVKDWVFAVTNVRAYQKLNSQLIQAQADLAGGKDPIALKQRIGALKAELKANVMNPYINAGLLSSIVEDVNIQQGEYTYASAFKQTVDEKTRWIPKPVKTAAKVLTIAPSTKLYQFLATTTQLSDFVAKYSMSKHLQANGTDINASIIEASKTFINYDVPTSQGLQYANDMGLFMFTKFFLRIQAVLMKLLGKRAGSVIAQHLLVENLTGAEGVLSPMAFGHIGNNPLESSVAGLPSAFFGIGTIDAVTDFGVSF